MVEAVTDVMELLSNTSNADADRVKKQTQPTHTARMCNPILMAKLLKRGKKYVRN